MSIGAAGKRWKDTGLKASSYLVVGGLKVLRRISSTFPTFLLRN